MKSVINFASGLSGLTTEGIQHCFWRGMWKYHFKLTLMRNPRTTNVIQKPHIQFSMQNLNP